MIPFYRRFGVDAGDTYRAEVRHASGEVKGVYSWLKPDGSPHMITYAAGNQGYRAVPLAQLGVTLPRLPHGLYAGGAQPSQPRPYGVFGQPFTQQAPVSSGAGKKLR